MGQPLPEFPSGTVTFLFTDIAGSTALWERDREAMRAAVERHVAILDAAIAAHGGVRFKIVGDAVQAAFPTAPAAVAAALAAQRALNAEDWPETGPLRVRMGVHTGEAQPRDGDYLAPALNRLSRLLNAGHGGQILLTEAAHHLARGALPPQASVRDLGRHRLRDLLDAEVVYQLLHPDLPAEFPHLRSLDTQPTNLPAQPTLFVGRERELDEIVSLLSEGGIRLLTLTGPGGTGKTRLALQAAADLLDDFPDGVFFVPLATIADAALAPAAIATALAIPETAGQTPREQVLTELAERSLLLVLDNLEQLPDLGPFVAELLATAPGLAVLATSRAPLRVRGEREYPVLPLPLPGEISAGSLDAIAASDAVRLFVDRAQAIMPGFALDANNADAVAEIVRRLDGLPLAIELAAARVRLFAPEAMLKRLETRLPLLTGGPRDLPERQRALRATIAWSYDLLTPGEQALFRRLAVFAGGMTLDAVAYVGRPEGTIDALDGLERLVEHSLIQTTGDGESEPRFRMLETIREYGLERLAESGEVVDTRSRHLGFFLDLAEQATLELTGPGQGAWLARLEAEHDNLRAALSSAATLSEDAPALRLAAALAPFWEARGHYSEGRDWLERTLARGASEPKSARAAVLTGAGSIARMQGDTTRATELLEAALALADALGDRAGAGRIHVLLGHVADRRGDLSGAAERFEAALAVAREIGDRALTASALGNLGIVADLSGDSARATAAYEEALAIFRELGDRRREAAALDNLGVVARGQGQLAKATRRYEEAMAVRRELGDAWGIAATLGNLGVVAHQSGDFTQARVYYEESLAGFRALGDLRGVAGTLGNLGTTARLLGNLPEAAALQQEALAIAQDAGDQVGIATELEGIAAVAVAAGISERAVRLIGAAADLRETTGASIPPDDRPDYERTLAAARAQLGPARFEEARDAGHGLRLEEAVTEALALAQSLTVAPLAARSCS
jgi:predicted ATPase/class 3 adenylate cyclase/Tfp pilus assembly protein PilF